MAYEDIPLVKQPDGSFKQVQSVTLQAADVFAMRLQCIDIASRNSPSRSAEEIVQEATRLMDFVTFGKR